jgi:hypothetical protein
MDFYICKLVPFYLVAKELQVSQTFVKSKCEDQDQEEQYGQR